MKYEVESKFWFGDKVYVEDFNNIEQPKSFYPTQNIHGYTWEYGPREVKVEFLEIQVVNEKLEIFLVEPQSYDDRTLYSQDGVFLSKEECVEYCLPLNIQEHSNQTEIDGRLEKGVPTLNYSSYLRKQP